jgi:hypothetical protein
MRKISTKNLDLLPDINTLKNTCMAVAMLDAILFLDDRYYSFFSELDYPRKNNEMMFYMTNGSGSEYKIFFNDSGVIICGFTKESPLSPFFYERYYDAIYIRIDEAQGIPPRREPTKYAYEFSGKQEFIKNVPEEFKYLMDYFYYNEADKIYEITFCIWRKKDSEYWETGNSPEDEDLSENYLTMLDGIPETFLEWAQIYYGISEEGIEHKEKINELFPDIDLDYQLYLDLDLVKYIYDLKPLTEKIVQTINPQISIEDLKADLENIGYPVEE